MISIKEHQQYLEHLYSKQNSQFNWDYLWGYLSRTTSYLFLAIDKRNATGYEFIKPISWLFGIASKFEVCIEDAFIRRFPDVCPYCLAKPCCCVKSKKKPVMADIIYSEQIKEELARRYNLFRLANNQIITFEFIMDFIADIYPQNEYVWKIAGLGSSFHFKKIHEEIAEIHESLCQYEKGSLSKRSISDEITDVFAWLLSAWHLYSNRRNLTDEFAIYYKDNCPICKRVICLCGSRKERNQGLFDTEIAYSILKVLDDLENTEFHKKAQHHAVSIKAAIESKTIYNIRSSVVQARDFLNLVLINCESEKKS